MTFDRFVHKMSCSVVRSSLFPYMKYLRKTFLGTTDGAHANPPAAPEIRTHICGCPRCECGSALYVCLQSVITITKTRDMQKTVCHHI